MLAIVVALKLDRPDPVLYIQERIAELDDTFTDYKFRRMVTDTEEGKGANSVRRTMVASTRT